MKHPCATFNVLIERFGVAGIGHHYGDERLMEKYGSVKDGRLTIGQCTYSFVVIPDCDTLDSSTAAFLKEYLAQGGRLMLRVSTASLPISASCKVT